MTAATDARWMARALRLAERGGVQTSPNPRVGCVLVRDGKIVGEGWHRRAGGPHAEVEALRQAGDAAAGATAYVTLEPCSHHGRTPPCAEALCGAGVARVVAAMQDPNPLVAGRGLSHLRAAGVRVEDGLMAGSAVRLNPGFIKRMRTGMPWVRLKLAASLDGRTAMASGESQWITGEASRRDVHRWRGACDVVLTGVDTVLADDPALNVRLPGEWRQPLRVVLDSRLRTPPQARLLSLPGNTVIVTGLTEAGERTASLVAQGAEVVTVPMSGAHLDLTAVFDLLGQRGINTVWVECGARLSGALLQARMVDEMVVYSAPRLMGTSARGLAEFAGLDRLDQTPRLALCEVRRIGEDLRIVARPE